MDNKLWDTTTKLISKWTHRIQVVSLWSSVVISLTNAAATYAHEADESILSVSINVPTVKSELNIDLKMTAEFLFHTWYRMTFIIPHPNEFSPPVFIVAMKGIASVIEIWSSQEGKRVSGNTLLKMYGEWLFDGAMNLIPGYEEGRSVAVGSLCRIFSKPQQTQFKDNYLAAFYRCIMKVRQFFTLGNDK